MHVESVTWIAERKDVLYVFFFMLSLIVYLKFIQEQGTKKIFLYVLLVVLFLLSVLSKAMAIVLPFVLLLIDYYKSRKFDKNIILEKIPFFAFSFVFGLLAVKIQSNGAIAHFTVFTIPQRICFASFGIVNYIYKLFAPINLSCFYRYPSLVDNHMPYIYYFAPVIVLTLLGLTIYLTKKNKVLFFGVFFFIITVAMVLQFISVGKAIVADRYTYLSYIGIFFIIGMGYDWLQNKTEAKYNIYIKVATIVLGAFLVFLFYQTFQRTKVWIDSNVLWTDAINKDSQSETAYTNRGSYLINKISFDVDKKNIGEPEYDKALADFNISINMSPYNAKVFTNRANIYGTKKQFDLALKDYSKAIQLDSTDAEVYANRGVTYSIMKQYDKAILDYNKAIAMRPNFTTAKQNRAYAYVSSGQYEKGIKELNELIMENPYKADFFVYRGVAYYNIKNYSASLNDNTSAINIEPNNDRAYYNRSATFKITGKFKDALNDALKAKSLGYPVEANYLDELNAKAR
jgi:tetratricopeptide (TPR) repeat protein